MSKHNGKDESYACDAQQRGYFVMLALAGHEFDGVSMTSIAAAWAQRVGKPVANQKNNIFRDLQNLKLQGCAEQLPDSDRWRLGARFVQIALDHLRGMEKATARLEETRQRYSRQAN